MPAPRDPVQHAIQKNLESIERTVSSPYEDDYHYGATELDKAELTDILENLEYSMDNLRYLAAKLPR